MKSLFHPGRRRSNSLQYDSGISGVSGVSGSGGSGSQGSGDSSLLSAHSGELDMVTEEGRDGLSSSLPKGRLDSRPGPRRMRSASLSVAGPDWADSSAAILVQTRNLPVDYGRTAVPLLKSFSLPCEEPDADAPQPLVAPTASEKELNLFMVEEPEQGLGRLLQAFTCYEAVPNASKVVALDVHLPVKKALGAFLTNSVRAALLWESASPTDPGRLVGLLSITDFIRVLLKFHDETYSRRGLRVGVGSSTALSVEVELGSAEVAGLVTPPSSLPEDDGLLHSPNGPAPVHTKESGPAEGTALQMDSVERRLEEQEIGSWRRILKEQGCLEPLLTITSHESLFRAAQLLSQRRLHRLPILDPQTANPLHILTLKAILHFAWRRGARLAHPEALTKTPEELGLGVWGLAVRSVLPSTPLLDCLRLLMDKGLSGLPVVTAEGRVVDVFTRFDAIGVAADGAFDRLAETSVEDALHRRTKGLGWEGVVSCRPDEALDAVVEKLVQKEVHRVLIVGPGEKLMGLVAISDVVSLLVLQPMAATEPLGLRLPLSSPPFPSPMSLPSALLSASASAPREEDMEWSAGVADEMDIIQEEAN